MTTETMLALLDPSLSREERLARVMALIQEGSDADGDLTSDDELLADDGLVEDLVAELEELRHRNAVLADALGACRNCWGEHDDCPLCGGNGGPGRRRPDPLSFEVLVAPAIARTRPRRAVPATRIENGGTPR